MQTILLLATLQAAFLVALLLSKRQRQFPDLVLAAWLTVIGLHTLVAYLFARFGLHHPLAMNLSSGVPFLQGPFLYFYVDALTAPRARPRGSWAWHLAPFVAFVGSQLAGWKLPGGAPHAGRVDVHLFDLSMVSNAVLLLSVPVYIVWTLILLGRFKQRVLDTFSTIDRINLSWLRSVVTALGIVWTCVVIVFMVRKLTGGTFGIGHLILAPVAVFVYAVGFFGFRQTTVFSDVLLQVEELPRSESEEPLLEPTSKYRRSGLTEGDAAATLAQLVALMEGERPYLDGELTLPQVAAELEVSVHHLSQVINSQCGQNFHDFVNGYRVSAVKERLEDPANQAVALLHIAMDCGFGSKSSFNRIFKDATGQTPSQYRRGLAREG